MDTNYRNAREIFDLIVKLAWKNGEPGIVFLDRLNRDNVVPSVGATLVRNVIDGGYKGKLFLVNPRHDFVFGQRQSAQKSRAR